MAKIKGYELRVKSKSDLLKQLEELKLEVHVIMPLLLVFFA